MADFKTVFGITWKVVLSLAVISLSAWIAYSVFSNVSQNSEGKEETRHLEAELQASYQRDDTSAEHTKMPQSVWDKRITWAIKHHCWFNGMTRDEVIRALGQPTKQEVHDTYSSLFWSWQTKDCVQYSGDACAQYRREEQHLNLLRNGYITRGIDDDCRTLNGEPQAIPSSRVNPAEGRR